MPQHDHSVILTDVSYSWPDGTPALTGVDGVFGAGRTALIGSNGAGKSTLLRLIAGELTPSSGRIQVSGRVDLLRQDAPRSGGDVATLLGIGTVVAAIRAIASGSLDQEAYDLVGDDWDIEARAQAELAAAGLSSVSLDRPVATLSGGEAMRVALLGVRLRAAPIALLDEPSNNLDGPSRRAVWEMIDRWQGTLIVASHDDELLGHLEATAEIHDSALVCFPGPPASYDALVAARQQSVRRELRHAEQSLRAERAHRAQAEQRIARSTRRGRTDAANRKFVPAVVNDRKNAAEKAQGSRRGVLDARVTRAERAVDEVERDVREAERIRIDLPDPGVPAGRRVALLTGTDGVPHEIRGPERIALTGANGVGKSRLVSQLALETAGRGGDDAPLASAFVRVGLLDQRLADLDTDGTVLTVVAAVAGAVPAVELRNRLARLLIRGRMPDRPVRSLSGGERFRVAVARVLLADPPVQLLVLDEPTNNLDRPSTDRLVEALAGYRGALIVISHDRSFLERLDCGRELVLESSGALRETRHAS